MAITADYHMHSSFSEDSQAPMREMIEQGIAKGLTHMCFTEHMDIGFPNTLSYPAGSFTVNTDSYLYDLLQLREEYQDKIKILFGIELGIIPDVLKDIAAYAKSYEFDFVIASTHIIRGMDPYEHPYWDGRDEEEAFREYFQSELDSVKRFKNFDVYGHLDYAFRYAPSKDAKYSYFKYKDIIDKFLEIIIENEKGIEINTASIRKGFKDVHPYRDVLKRYKELGGEIITIGSDAHKPEDVAADFAVAEEALKDVGFKYYTIFENRIPEYKKL